MINFVLDGSHPSLSWQLEVVRELAKRVETLTVVTSHVEKDVSVTDNTEVVVPPNRPLGVPQRFGGRWLFGLDIYRLCRERRIEAVFIHMAKDWAYQLKPAFSLLRVPVVLWYAHGTVSWRLRSAVFCVDRVVTSTPEGCRLESRKIDVIGQAIDTDSFIPRESEGANTVLYVGRISQRKRVELIYDVAKAMVAKREATGAAKTCIVGSSRTLNDLRYEYALRSRIWNERMENSVQMLGHVPHHRLPEFYSRTFVHLNVSETGSMDKSVMEALAAGCPVLTSNPAFREILQGYPEFIITNTCADAIAEQIEHIHERRDEYDPWKLRNLVLEKHSMNTYAERILNVVQECVGS